MRSGIAMIAVMVGLASSATAGPKEKAKADALFKQGKQLLADKKYADACKAFQDSYELDPAIGTQLNLALCYEQWGKVATAQLAYLEAEKQAAVKGDKRAAPARQRADALAPRIPRLLFIVPEPFPTELVVSVDGKEVGPDALRVGLSVDPGAHEVRYRFGAGEATEIKAQLAESETKRITVETPKEPKPGGGGGGGTSGGTQLPPDPPATKLVSKGRTRRILGIVAAGTGVALIGVGGVVAIRARSDYNKAFDNHCSSVDNSCDEIGYEGTSGARTRAHIATGLMIGGAAVVAAGAVLFFTASKEMVPAGEHAVYVAPMVTGAGGGLVVGGSL